MRRASSRVSKASRRPPSRVFFELDVAERLTVVVPDDEAGVGLLDGPRRREAASLLRSQSASLRHHGRALSAASSPSSRAASQNGGSRLDHQSTGVLGVIGPLPYCDSCIIK
jgi:hypothetical protein